MNLRYFSLFASLCAALALTGCDSGRKVPPKTHVRVVNVAPGFAALRYQREHTDAPDDLAFKGFAQHDYDEDTYDFYVFERSLSSTTTGRTWTFSKQLLGTSNYVFVLAEAGDDILPQVVEYPTKLADSGDTQVAVVHAVEGLSAVDVYLQPTGVGIAGATPLGNLDFLSQLAPQTLTNGDYELTLTAAGDPSNVLFVSGSVTLAAGITNVFVISGEASLGTAAISVVMAQDNPANLYSTNATAALRVVNAAADGQPRDFAVNNEFSPPLFSAVPYGAATSYVTVPLASDLPINVTPVGNPGALELTSTIATLPGQQYTVVFSGDAGALTYNILTEDRRRIVHEPKLQIFDEASQFTTTTEYVLLPPGTADPSTIGAYQALLAPSVTVFSAVPAGTYDLLLRETSTQAVRAGPIPVTFNDGGLYTILTLNGPDTATANVVFLDDPPQ